MTEWPRALLLDTHAAIWLAEGQLTQAAADVVVFAGLADGVFVSPVTAWEIGLLARPRSGRPPRFTFLPNPQGWFANLMAKPIIKPAPLTNAAAIESSHLPGLLHDDPADRLLVATARDMDVALMTRDEAILRYDLAGHVRTWPC